MYTAPRACTPPFSVVASTAQISADDHPPIILPLRERLRIASCACARSSGFSSPAPAAASRGPLPPKRQPTRPFAPVFAPAAGCSTADGASPCSGYSPRAASPHRQRRLRSARERRRRRRGTRAAAPPRRRRRARRALPPPRARRSRPRASRAPRARARASRARPRGSATRSPCGSRRRPWARPGGRAPSPCTCRGPSLPTAPTSPPTRQPGHCHVIACRPTIHAVMPARGAPCAIGARTPRHVERRFGVLDREERGRAARGDRSRRDDRRDGRWRLGLLGGDDAPRQRDGIVVFEFGLASSSSSASS